MTSTSRTYRAAVRLGLALAPGWALFDQRVAASLRARRHAGDRLFQWARQRDRSRPLLWFHAASVGEGLQAESVLQRIRRLRPDCQIVYTHFSPSAECLAERIAADAADYLPYDLPENAELLLEALHPDLLVFSKLDLWSELATRAAAAGVVVALIAATVGPGSGRLRWPVRALLRPGYRAVCAAAAIAPEDAVRLARLGVPGERVQVMGDPRFDSVAERVAGVAPDDPLLRFGDDAPTLVAGSTWSGDETVLLHAFARVLRRHREARLIVAPHEPAEDHLRKLEQRATALDLPRPLRLSAAPGPARLLAVDQVGVLAKLYGAAGMAYVGGGFGRAGLHSVLEPAAWSVPVAFGPRWQNSRDAGLLLDAGAACALPAKGYRAIDTLEQQWLSWIEDAAEREAQGRRAGEVVERGRGASDRTAQFLLEVISRRRPRTSPLGAPAPPR